MEVDHEAPRGQRLAVFRSHDHATAGGEHNMVHEGHLLNHLLFAVAKAGLALDIKYPGDIGAGAAFNFSVSVGKRQTKVARKVLANGALAGPHGADQKNAL